MRMFHLVWMALCCVPGYLLTIHEVPLAIADAAFSLERMSQSVAGFSGMIFIMLWFGRIPASEITVFTFRSPFKHWPAALQLVCLTFLASGLWGWAFVESGLGGRNLQAPVGALAAGSVALLGLCLGCLTYRLVRRLQ